MRLIELKKGDAIILTCPMKLSDSAIENIKNTFRKNLGISENIPILILEEGMDISILTRG